MVCTLLYWGNSQRVKVSLHFFQAHVHIWGHVVVSLSDFCTIAVEVGEGESVYRLSEPL